MSTTAPTFRNGVLSIFQSAIDDFARARQGDGAARPGLESALVRAGAAVAATRVPAPKSSTLALDESVSDKVRTCAEHGLRFLEAVARGDQAAADQAQQDLKFSECDAQWISTLDAYVKYFGPTGGLRPIPYVRAGTIGNQVIDMKPGARVALIGDWGTGSASAVKLLQAVKQQNPDIVIHLGDIYYSGTDTECDTYFLQIVNDVLDRGRTRIPVFTLAGNHDMYSGGSGYYPLLAKLNDPPQRQAASFFCLRASDASWQFLGMDTGLHDHDPFHVSDVLTFLEKDEEDWHDARIGEFSGGTILLSHHQLFSAFSQIGPKDAKGSSSPCNPLLLASFNRFRATAAGRLAAWFWGHEHNLCIYEPYANLDFGRCIGHGAIPVFTSDNPYKAIPNMDDPPKLVAGTELKFAGDTYAHGYAMIALDGAKAAIHYFQETDYTQPMWSETIPAPVAAPAPGA